MLVIGDLTGLDFYREVTRSIGAAEYLAKPLNREMVARHFGPLAQGRVPGGEAALGGRVITVTGVRGGVGATTVAVNLARHFGTASFLLNVEPGRGLGTALQAPARIDTLLAERAAQPVDDRLHVLAAQEKLETTTDHAEGAAEKLLAALRRRYNFIVADVPYRPLPLYRDLLGLSHRRVLVMEPTLAGVRDTRRLVAWPAASSSEPARPLVVLNRLGRPGNLARRQIEDALQFKVDIAIADQPKLVGNAATLGKPTVETRGAFRDAIVELSRQVAFSRLLDTADVRFRDTAHLANVCQRIAAAVGRRVDEASPMVDARLKDGSRVNIVFPPLALDGPYVSIRKFGKKTIDFERLIGFGAMTQQVARILQLSSKARLNVIISGGTGSGKTTLMNAMSRLIDPAERVITVEDAAELQLQQPHVVRLETRPSNLEGRGEITQRDLMRNALRMRPDRVIIGEVRAGEAFDMLQAMNTGHDGSMSTVHANTTRDALTRIENMVQMGNMSLPSRAIRIQIVGAVHLIVQVERQRDGGRRITQVTEIRGMEGAVVLLNDIFQFVMTGEDGNGRIVGRYKVSKARPSFIARLNYFGLEREWMQALAADSP